MDRFKVKFTILGAEYSIWASCPEEEDYILKTAKTVSDQVEQILSSGSITELAALVYASMNMADLYYKELQNSENLRFQITQSASQVSKLEKEVVKLKGEKTKRTRKAAAEPKETESKPQKEVHTLLDKLENIAMEELKEQVSLHENMQEEVAKTQEEPSEQEEGKTQTPEIQETPVAPEIQETPVATEIQEAVEESAESQELENQTDLLAQLEEEKRMKMQELERAQKEQERAREKEAKAQEAKRQEARALEERRIEEKRLEEAKRQAQIVPELIEVVEEPETEVGHEQGEKLQTGRIVQKVDEPTKPSLVQVVEKEAVSEGNTDTTEN